MNVGWGVFVLVGIAIWVWLIAVCMAASEGEQATSIVAKSRISAILNVKSSTIQDVMLNSRSILLFYTNLVFQ